MRVLAVISVEIVCLVRDVTVRDYSNPVAVGPGAPVVGFVAKAVLEQVQFGGLRQGHVEKVSVAYCDCVYLGCLYFVGVSFLNSLSRLLSSTFLIDTL